MYSQLGGEKNGELLSNGSNRASVLQDLKVQIFSKKREVLGVFTVCSALC